LVVSCKSTRSSLPDLLAVSWLVVSCLPDLLVVSLQDRGLPDLLVVSLTRLRLVVSCLPDLLVVSYRGLPDLLVIEVCLTCRLVVSLQDEVSCLPDCRLAVSYL
ncbi:hypothetical protein L9F63_022208, partial [Diploptera punctata]